MNFVVILGAVIGFFLEFIFLWIVGEEIGTSFFGYIVGIFLLIGPIAGLSYLYKRGLSIEAQNATTEELIEQYNESAKTVNNLSGSYGSKLIANHNQNQIEDAQLRGKAAAQALAARGYNVDTTALNGSAEKSTSYSGKRSVVKDAVVGGIIAGAPGAIVGALHAVDKNNQSKK